VLDSFPERIVCGLVNTPEYDIGRSIIYERASRDVFGLAEVDD
jgi:hypothetical protein